MVIIGWGGLTNSNLLSKVQIRERNDPNGLNAGDKSFQPLSGFNLCFPQSNNQSFEASNEQKICKALYHNTREFWFPLPSSVACMRVFGPTTPLLLHLGWVGAEEIQSNNTPCPLYLINNNCILLPLISLMYRPSTANNKSKNSENVIFYWLCVSPVATSSEN